MVSSNLTMLSCLVKCDTVSSKVSIFLTCNLKPFSHVDHNVDQFFYARKMFKRFLPPTHRAWCLTEKKNNVYPQYIHASVKCPTSVFDCSTFKQASLEIYDYLSVLNSLHGIAGWWQAYHFHWRHQASTVKNDEPKR